MPATSSHPVTATGSPSTARRAVFVTREPIVHQMGGSTTSALNLLEVLQRQGAAITIVATLAFSRSPRLWFRTRVALPVGMELRVPGYRRLGAHYVRVFAPLAWARAASRLGARVKVLAPLRSLAKALFGNRLFDEAWDLTLPTERECEAALHEIETSNASTVIVNYAFWSPLLERMAAGSAEMRACRRIILMHDLLSARVRRFLDAGKALDCPEIDEATELAWLDRADCVLASQAREAEYIQPRVRARVLVQPIVLRARRLAETVEPHRCLFVGSNILPNTAGLDFFLEQVWPKVRAANAAARLAVVGTICQALPAGLEGMGIEAMGTVAAIEREYARAAVCVVPLLIGSGIKIKLIEALSFGKATVSTSVGIQGIEEWAAGTVDVADDAEGFAAAVLRLLADEHMRKQRENAALALVEEHYGAERALAPEFLEALFG